MAGGRREHPAVGQRDVQDPGTRRCETRGDDAAEALRGEGQIAGGDLLDGDRSAGCLDQRASHEALVVVPVLDAGERAQLGHEGGGPARGVGRQEDAPGVPGGGDRLRPDELVSRGRLCLDVEL